MEALSLQNILIALGLTFLAGMSTGVGALMAFFTKATNKKLLAGALGLSAGVMLYVSFVDLMPVSFDEIKAIYPGKKGEIFVTLAFFAGILLIAIIDFLIPESENPHEMQHMDSIDEAGESVAVKSDSGSHHLRRTGFMLALAIGIHNFPEGIATFVSSLNGVELAVPIVVAIAIHNVPEGVAVSMPI